MSLWAEGLSLRRDQAIGDKVYTILLLFASPKFDEGDSFWCCPTTVFGWKAKRGE